VCGGGGGLACLIPFTEHNFYSLLPKKMLNFRKTFTVSCQFYTVSAITFVRSFYIPDLAPNPERLFRIRMLRQKVLDPTGS
jgi:hypothetical protein